MKMTDTNRAVRAPRSLLALGTAAVLIVLLAASGGCQGRPAPKSKLAQVLLDSLLAGNEAMYDSATANLGWDRVSCLDARVLRLLGDFELERLSSEAARTVRSRHTRVEYMAGERGISMLHDAPSESFCRQVDSLWYATMSKRPQRRP